MINFDLRRLVNISIYLGWSFKAGPLKADKDVFEEGETVFLSALVKNNGLFLGTAYAIVRVAPSLDHEVRSFDSHEDFRRDALWLRDIPVGGSQRVSCHWQVPTGTAPGPYEVRLEIWSPPKMQNKRGLLLWPRLFDGTGWQKGAGGFMVVKPDGPMVFISYVTDRTELGDWVQKLIRKLRLSGIRVLSAYQDLRPGDDPIGHTEHCIAQAEVIVLICSETYTRMANAHDPGGVGGEAVITPDTYRWHSVEKHFIPVIRDNRLPEAQRLPTYLGRTVPIHMDGPDWEDGAQRLIAAIKSPPDLKHPTAPFRPLFTPSSAETDIRRPAPVSNPAGSLADTVRKRWDAVIEFVAERYTVSEIRGIARTVGLHPKDYVGEKMTSSEAVQSLFDAADRKGLLTNLVEQLMKPERNGAGDLRNLLNIQPQQLVPFKTNVPTPEKRVFLSHVSLDKPFVRDLKTGLEADGFACWLDEGEIRGGLSLPGSIEDGIVSSRYFVIVLSPEAVASRWVRLELDIAVPREIAKQILVIPILLRECQIPPILAHKKYIDFRTSFDAGYRQLLEALKGAR